MVLSVACALGAGTAAAQQSPNAPAELRPTVNLYGLPGLIDMPTAEAQPDGELNATVSTFGGIFRNTLAFQLTPRISGAFRYSAFRDWNSDGFETYYDRSFDLRYQLFFEGRYRPAVAIGLQDFAGTGILAGEYIVATKTVRPGLTVTGGLGWGRLGSYNSIGSLFGSNRPTFDASSTGGQFSFDQWFRGPAAPFGGIEWRPSNRLGFKIEYSSDAYTQEAVNRSVIDRASPWSFGVEYQWNDTTRLGAYSVYGDSIGFLASFALNPARAQNALRLPAPGPLSIRPSRETSPELWTTAWADSETLQEDYAQRLTGLLNAEGQTLLALRVTAFDVELRVENTRYGSAAAAIGRISRILAAVMPQTVETFRIVFVEQGLPVSTVVLRRSDLEALEVRPDAAEVLQPLVGVTAASSADAPPAVRGVYPRFQWGLSPYFRQSFFDPANPFLFEVGVRARASYEFSPGFSLSGSVAQEIYSQLDDARVSGSNLPPVRTQGPLFEQGSDPVLENLTLSYVRSFGNDFYGRATAGYLERMFGGVSAEVLWKPVSSSLGLGVEVNYARQRDFDSVFGFQSYDVITGHASAYYDWGNGFHTQLDVGRYLAGDIGATLTVDREFANGWRIGAFATVTDVSSADFGEGSFDKGIRLTIPLNWAGGQPTRSTAGTVIRPVQRDGGARLDVPGRLYDRVRSGHSKRINDGWARIWR
ncbi:YjbH domain-containing protein [Aestuariivita sp.]|jgi:hypothetical protein|uniref:YjbH domain-containing protein n=1 Tax=Aestuariivita sp. TaxID=1872407 RepID=UPI00216E2904|nr:YjbH domain-containing protein [Aestuariivita sp.]MCE8005551.1 YjbH domain-containing protein [Aestuariivita sp.]